MNAQNSLFAKEKEEDDDSVVLAVRVPRQLREDFKNLCKKHEVDVSVVIRRFLAQEVKAGQKL